ncbi:Ger(x)C family spore germination protein [Ectobacillus funiculus]|uniref:Ger(x)C family spore germination protein n=1 Tax=Ectobacillus funiculus TaxID=137993 RepID=UPI00101BC022|nr:Ger(x)C family spore germination protein [Ectobacillus funiculus]
MKRITAIFVIMSFLLSLTTGCGSRRELNELAIVSGIAIDKQKGQYLVSAQVVDPGEVSDQKSGVAPATFYKAKGKSLLEALRRVSVKAPRKLYASHLQMLVISEKVASQGIGKILDAFFRDPDFRSDFLIVVTKGIEAQQLLLITTPIDKIPVGNMFKSLISSEKIWASVTTVTIDALVSDLVSEGKDPILTGITVTHKTEKKKLEKANKVTNIQQMRRDSVFKYVGLAVFKKDKLIGWLNEEESSGYNYVIDNVVQTAETIVCPKKKGNMTVIITKSHSKIKGIVENGKPKIQVRIQAKGKISEIDCKGSDITNPRTISLAETQIEQAIKRHVKTTVQTVQRKYQADIFGFGNSIQGAHPKAWNTMKKDWDKTFAHLPVDIDVRVTIQRTGKLKKSFIDDIK